MLLKSAIRYILFRKAGEQLGLFDIPVPIKPYVRDGKVIAGHVATRKKRIAPKGKQPDLFGVAEPQGEAVKLGRLGHFIERHGGYTRVHAMLQGYTDDQRNTMLDSMAKLAGKTRAEVVDILANGAKHETPKAPEGDLFDGVEAEAPRQEGPKTDDPRQRAIEAVKAGKIAMMQFKNARGGWATAFGVIDCNTVYSKPSAYSLGYDSLDDGKWRPVTADEYDLWLKEYVDRGRDGSKWHGSALDVMAVAEQADQLVKEGKQRESESQSAEHQSLIAKYRLPADTLFEAGRFALTRGKWRATNGDLETNWKDTSEDAAQELRQWIDGSESGKKEKARYAAATQALVGKLKSGENPSFEEWKAVFPDLKPHHTYLRQAEISPLLIEHFGFSRNAIRAGLGRAAGYLESDTGATYPIVYFNRLAEVLGGNKDNQGRDLAAVKGVDEPKEGDTKTEGGIEYRLTQGRWHRTTPEGKPAFTPTHELPDGTQVIAHADEANVWVDAQGDEYESEEAYPLSDDPTEQIDNKLDQQEARWAKPEYTVTKREKPKDSLAQLRDRIEEMGGKAQVAENLRMAFKDHSVRTRAEAVINELADATGLDRDTVLAEMGIKEVVRKPAGERTRPDTLSTGGEYTDDDPNSPNYRFRDTGYIGDSRKELAAESIREHARNGQRLRATDIDWQEIEKNPRQAKELITKSNLFGKVDWEALKANGMEPGAGFLVDRVYASIAPEPSADDAKARKDYAVGLETLRDRLESCKTPENVTEVLEELRDEYDGIIFNEREKAAYEQAEAIYQEISTRRWTLKKELDALQQAANKISGQINSMAWEQEKRERRKWKRDPEVDKQVEALRPAQDAAIQAVQDWKDAHPEAEERYEQESETDAQGNMHVRMRLTGGLYGQERAAFEVMQNIRAFSLSRNREENPLHRAWRLMGPKFLTVLKWRSGKNAFQGHVTSAKTGKIKDWSWAEKQHVTAPRSTEGKVKFQLRVAENFSRVGGRDVRVDSTDELKRRFGLRDVQSGNWVLTDPESAAFHVQHAAEALSDLSDLLGIPEDKLFVNGRVALAFGARGKGNAGFGGAARAHYERIHRVINLTKMGGGGALAHELFHAIDNLAKEAETGQPGDSEDFITDNPDLLPDGPLKQAVRGLRSAMLDGDKRLWQTLKYTTNDARLAKHNLDRAAPSKMAVAIKDASDLESALLAIDGFYPNGWTSKRTEKQREEWRRIAAAWHGGMNLEGGKVQAKAGAPVSDFAYQAHLLDGGMYGKYWSNTHEMAARAFQAWCEDRLSDQGRKNDYLSAFADNQYYKDPIFGDSKPFPEGRERERINAAIDDLVYALRESGTLRKAFELLVA